MIDFGQIRDPPPHPVRNVILASSTDDNVESMNHVEIIIIARANQCGRRIIINVIIPDHKPPQASRYCYTRVKYGYVLCSTCKMENEYILLFTRRRSSLVITRRRRPVCIAFDDINS